MEFYRLNDDVDFPRRWFLDDPQLPDGAQVDPQSFTIGNEYVGSEELTVVPRRRGEALDFTFGTLGMPVVTERLGEILRLEGLPAQFIPVHVEGYGRYQVFNVTSCVDALDRDASAITYWMEDDNVPEKVGQIFLLYRAVLKASAAQRHRIFRLYGWEQDIIIDEKLMICLKELSLTGVKFERVDVL